MHVISFAFAIFALSSLTPNSVICYKCTKSNHKEMSKTKCVAGRRFFARLDKMPTFKNLFPKVSFLRPYLYPWIAEINLIYPSQQQSSCTGTLINDRYVITAQRCVLPPIQSQHISVTMGYPVTPQLTESQLLESESPHFVQSRVLQIILHPGFIATDARTISNDVALLKIPPVTYTKTIYPIQLPTIVDRFFDLTNVEGESVGWENMSPVIYFPKTFEKHSVKIIGNEVCSNFNLYYRQAINGEVLCTTNTVPITNGSCNNEPGSPLMVENNKRVYNVTILIGIVSWSAPDNGPCILNNPVIQVRIDNKLQWIKDNTKDALYCRY